MLDPSTLQSRNDKLKNALKSHQTVTQGEIEVKMITNDVVTEEVHEMVLGMDHEVVHEMVHPEITLTTQL